MRLITILLFINLAGDSLICQALDSLVSTNKDAIYSRPFILEAHNDQLSAAIGGYLEANTNYFVTEGITEGFSFEMRRFNIFLYSTLHERIKFLSELEFEHGTEEIAIETALLDFEFSPAFSLRAGILIVPLGYFNQNHDSPKWEFIDRPLVSTGLIPSTYSDIGIGFHGSTGNALSTFTYEAYLINGLGDRIIANVDDRTSLASGKNPDRFGEDNNGIPAITGRIALKNQSFGELGLSTYLGAYNTYKIEGVTVDDKRRLWIGAFDYNFEFGKIQLLGEMAMTKVDLPPGLGPSFGSRQFGFHSDLIAPIYQGDFLGWKNIEVNAALRYEFIDYNMEDFEGLDQSKGDHTHSILAGLSLRFSPSTVVKLNFRHRRDTDLVQNPFTKTGGIQFGFASYF